MNKVVRFFIVYTAFAVTGMAIGLIIVIRHESWAQSQTTQQANSIKQEVEKLQTGLDATGKLNEEINKIKTELAASREQNKTVKDVLGTTDKPTTDKLGLGAITLADTTYLTMDVYQQTSFSASVAGKMYANKTYRYLKKENSWYFVHIAEGQEGWVNSRFVKEIPDTSP